MIAMAVMFLDLVGFSKLNKKSRNNKLDVLQKLGSPLFTHERGMHINTWGDAIVAGFDDPNAAILLACKFIKHLAIENIDARIGMNYGTATVRHNPLIERPDIEGDSINIAARLESIARTGEVLISSELRYHPDIEKDRFVFKQQKRKLKKGVVNMPEDSIIDCYAVNLYENNGKKRQRRRIDSHKL